MADRKLEELKTRLMEIADLGSASAVLGWDQSTYMPEGGAAARGRQLALMGRLAQEKATDPALGKLLDGLRAYEESLPYDDDDASLIRLARRDFEQAVRVPPEFVARASSHFSESYQAWAKARPENDFPAVRPFLEKTLDLSRELANYFPGYDHIADPLIDFEDYGMKAASVRKLFSELRAAQLPISRAILSQEPADDFMRSETLPRKGAVGFLRGAGPCHRLRFQARPAG